jgi:hypothetical protein
MTSPLDDDFARHRPAYEQAPLEPHLTAAARGRCSIRAAVSRRGHDEHVAACAMGEPVGHGSQDAPSARHPAVTHNDHLRVLLVGDADQHLRWVALTCVSGHLNAFAPEAGAGSFDNFLRVTRAFFDCEGRHHRTGGGCRPHLRGAWGVGSHDMQLGSQRPCQFRSPVDRDPSGRRTVGADHNRILIAQLSSGLPTRPGRNRRRPTTRA